MVFWSGQEPEGLSGGPAVLPPQLSPDLGRSGPPSAFIVDAPDRRKGFGVLFGPVGRFSGVAGDGGMRMIGRRSERQNAADWLDSAASRCFSMKAIICEGRSSSAWMRHSQSGKREHPSFSAIEA